MRTLHACENYVPLYSRPSAFLRSLHDDIGSGGRPDFPARSFQSGGRLAVLLAPPLAAKPPPGKGGGKGGDEEPSPQPPADPAIAFALNGSLTVMNADATKQTVIWDEDLFAVF